MIPSEYKTSKVWDDVCQQAENNKIEEIAKICSSSMGYTHIATITALQPDSGNTNTI
jgi:hypothetical protein